MTDFRRFDPSELDPGEAGGGDNAEAAELLAVARDLEAFARAESVALSVDFEDRVMAAIADEPPPRPVGSGGPLGFFTLVWDAWRLTWSGDRPVVVRAQALAFVLLAAVALGSLASLAVVGIGRLLSPDPPAPTVVPSPSPSPSALPTPSPSVSPSPSATPSPTPETAEPTETPEPSEAAETTSDSSGPESGEDRTPRPTDDSSGPGSGGDSSGSGSGG